MSSAAISLPPVLREGDRLTAREFLHRWNAMSELKQAELIDGIVFMPSPVGQQHGKSHIALGGWLWLYAGLTPGCEAAAESTWVMGRQDVPQPDASLRILPEWGGQSHNTGDYVAGAPELIVEVSGSSSSRDLGVKLDLYRRSGVREYLTVLLKPRQVIWRQLVRSRYKEIAPGEDGILRSTVFPGLWLDPSRCGTRSGHCASRSNSACNLPNTPPSCAAWRHTNESSLLVPHDRFASHGPAGASSSEFWRVTLDLP